MAMLGLNITESLESGEYANFIRKMKKLSMI